MRNDKWYPQTKHHIGTDYLTPSGTPVLAPTDGKILTSGFATSLGNYCIFEYTWEGIKYQARFMHLLSIPKQGSYAGGSVIAKTGATGNVTGAHLHIDVFYNEVRLDKLTEANFKLLTADPQEHFALCIITVGLHVGLLALSVETSLVESGVFIYREFMSFSYQIHGYLSTYCTKCTNCRDIIYRHMNEPIDNWHRFDGDSDTISDDFNIDEDMEADVDEVDFDKMTDNFSF